MRNCQVGLGGATPSPPAFLTKGGVFTKDFIDLWIEYKMKKEVDPMRMRPHPHEFELYYDI